MIGAEIEYILLYGKIQGGQKQLSNAKKMPCRASQGMVLLWSLSSLVYPSDFDVFIFLNTFILFLYSQRIIIHPI